MHPGRKPDPCRLRAADYCASRGADLQPVARATEAGGLVTMRPARPAKARYLLLWFTRLPPDSSGTFEAIVYDVRLHGIA
jgi:hypothetical protein